MGLWDQTLALKFLHEVLPSFGGDPDRITVSGHSAGSASVGALMFSPHSHHLFNQAIELSGSIFAEFAMSEMVVQESRALADAVGCKIKESEKVHDCMKERTIDEILDGVEAIEPTRRHTNNVKFQPHFDKDFFPFEIEKLARKAPKKKTLQGITTLESGILVFSNAFEYIAGKSGVPESKWDNFTREDILDYIRTAVAPESEFGHQRRSFLDLLTQFYVDGEAPEKPDSQFYIQRYVELISDLMFNIPVFQEVDLKRMNGWETYYYVIDYESEATKNDKIPTKGVFHCVELRFLFEFMGQENIPLSEKDEIFQQHLFKSFVNFIKSGTPSTSYFKWKPVTSEKPWQHVRFNEKPQMKDGFRQMAIEFWLKTVPNAIGTDLLRKGRLPASKEQASHTEL